MLQHPVSRVAMFALAIFLLGPAAGLHAQETQAPAGLFEGQSDVGSVTPPGTGSYNSAAETYTLTAAGANLWDTTDAFHFLWKKISGDAVLTADITFPVKVGEHNPHRKAILIFRQDLTPGSPYVDAAQHGVGLMALQYRPTQDATTDDIELPVEQAPRVLRLIKRGDAFTMELSMSGEPLHAVGASIHLHLQEPFYVGIGLSSHDPGRVERAVFSHVTLENPEPLPANLTLNSTVQVVNTDSNFARAIAVYSAPAHFEAPNWSHDGKTLIFDEDGKIMTVSADGGSPQPLDTGEASHCNGSHGVSPDGQWLAISCSMPGKPESHVYIVPVTGGAPRLVTEHPNSYFHSWSADGKTIIFTRPDHGASNIYAISAQSGPERALTTGTGISDDPDCSPDGQWIYFNSDRGGSMQIWRMHSDGSAPEPVTHDGFVNWTPHVSPDGKTIVFISYEPGTTGHPANRPIALRLLSLDTGKIRTLVHLTGGTGTMNVSSWAPDSHHLAFVSYEELPGDEASAQRN
ncbi:MAG: DPP IV N-terminal domain-containing protein [Acidobacteriaceae bacterium]